MRLATGTAYRFEDHTDGVPHSATTIYTIKNQVGDPTLYIKPSCTRTDGFGDGNFRIWGDHTGDGWGIAAEDGLLFCPEHLHLTLLNWWEDRP